MRNSYTTLWLASIELLLASGLWGFGFIATRWVLEVLGPMELTVARFSIAGCIGLPLVLIKTGRGQWRHYAKLGFAPALFMLLMLVFQTWGMQYTTATKSGFITTLYVVFVPLIEIFLGGQRFSRWLWLSVGMALVGTALIVNLGLGALNVGDFLTVLCAICAAGQIYVLGLYSGRVQRAFVFIFYQCYWSLLMAAPTVSWSSMTEKLSRGWDLPDRFWVGLLMLAIGSTIVAFSLQVRAQRFLSPTVASLICLLESPIAMFFALYFLDESLSVTEWAGACLIFIAALMATLIEARTQKGLPTASPRGTMNA